MEVFQCFGRTYNGGVKTDDRPRGNIALQAIQRDAGVRICQRESLAVDVADGVRDAIRGIAVAVGNRQDAAGGVGRPLPRAGDRRAGLGGLRSHLDAGTGTAEDKNESSLILECAGPSSHGRRGRCLRGLSERVEVDENQQTQPTQTKSRYPHGRPHPQFRPAGLFANGACSFTSVSSAVRAGRLKSERVQDNVPGGTACGPVSVFPK